MSGCERRDVRDIIVGVVICKIRIDSGGERERRERGVLRFEPSEFRVNEKEIWLANEVYVLQGMTYLPH